MGVQVREKQTSCQRFLSSKHQVPNPVKDDRPGFSTAVGKEKTLHNLYFLVIIFVFLKDHPFQSD